MLPPLEKPALTSRARDKVYASATGPSVGEPALQADLERVVVGVEFRPRLILQHAQEVRAARRSGDQRSVGIEHRRARPADRAVWQQTRLVDVDAERLVAPAVADIIHGETRCRAAARAGYRR